MCGIFCIIAPGYCKSNKETFQNIYKTCEVNIKRRGPDYEDVSFKSLANWDLMLASSVLWLQGLTFTKQPVESERFIFLYNGDIFDTSLNSTSLSEISRRLTGDTKPLLQCIESSESIVSVLSHVQGPYAFVLIDKINLKLYFGRDTFGRRSLLIGKDKNNILLTSVASKNCNFQMIELPALGVYCIDLNINTISYIKLFPWRTKNQHFREKLDKLEQFLNLKIDFDILEETLDSNASLVPTSEEILFLESLEPLKINKSFSAILSNKKWFSNILTLQRLLEEAIEKRIINQPKFCRDCIISKLNCQHATVGILFSGGLDCAVVALLTDKFIEPFRPIDLMNVAFEKDNSFNTPDRVTSKQTVEELKRLRPDRNWNLLQINVSQETLVLERSERISNLIYPLKSILDESLGCALWFAARGRTETYDSPCRVELSEPDVHNYNMRDDIFNANLTHASVTKVLLVGMGADELLGGYSRHRGAYKRGNWSELTVELDNDWKNISHRNLARDDRVVSDHGRQLRTPYLDENVVTFLRTLNSWEKCYPSEALKHTLGDKLLLRTLAYHLGLTQAATFRKRALQFGSRIANSKENAYDNSPRL